MSDREVIQKMLDKGYSKEAIAKELHFHPTSIYREIKRNSEKEYFASIANKFSKTS